MLARSELLGELLDGKELAERRTGWIVDILQKTIQAYLIAHSHNNVDAHGLVCWKLADERRMPIENHGLHMVCQQGLRLGKSGGSRHNKYCKQRCCNCQQRD
jgi:hypothetical protein